MNLINSLTLCVVSSSQQGRQPIAKAFAIPVPPFVLDFVVDLDQLVVAWQPLAVLLELSFNRFRLPFQSVSRRNYFILFTTLLSFEAIGVCAGLVWFEFGCAGLAWERQD